RTLFGWPPWTCAAGRGTLRGCDRPPRRTDAYRGRSLMCRLDLGSTWQYCDGLNRRSFLQLGVAGMASAGLGQVWQARADSVRQPGARDTSVILIWLDGGPSHMDLYDLKPEAPAEYRGIWRPIQTCVTGF